MNMDREVTLLLRESITFKSKMDSAYRCKLQSPKDSRASELARKEGNVLFTKQSHSLHLHAEVLSLYNKSAALAPQGSQELAFAYGNRSAFLLHIEKYQECIDDIDRALKINKSDELKIKLLCRKVECLKYLGIACDSILDEVRSLVNNIDAEDDDKKLAFNEMVTKVAALLLAEKDNTSKKLDETVSLRVTENVLEKVSIRHNEKYGRYLVAEQDYNPGDIIFVEKWFSTTVVPTCRYTNCHHCLRDCWTGVPCDNCNWVIFCSEDCRQEAWREYHDVECSVGIVLNNALGIDTWAPCSLSIKILIKAIKDAGSIDNLRAQLEAVDQCTDLCSKGFFKDGKMMNNTIESFWSLNKTKFPPQDEKNISKITLITLIGLLKCAECKNFFSAEKVEKVNINNKDILYLGCLLIDFTEIFYNNSFVVNHSQSMYDTFRYGDSGFPRGDSMVSLSSLINSSCCANANRFFSEDGKVIVYAVQPIAKNSQIFITYAAQYYAVSLRERKLFLKNYNIECDCRACIESWPPLLFEKMASGDLVPALIIAIMKNNFNHPMLLQILDSGNGTLANTTEAEFMKECVDILPAIINNDYGKAILGKLVEKIPLAFKCLKQPSLFTCMMQDALNSCVANVYNGLKRQTFGNCKRM